MSGPSLRSFVALVALLAPVCPLAGSARAAIGTPSLREPAIGPPRGLRTERVLDRATLEAWGIERPSRLVYDADGSLYVLDASRRRVVKVDAGGRFQHEVELAGADDARLVQPADLAIDARGSVLVLDRAAGSLLAYDRHGSLLASHDFAPDLIDEARVPGAAILLDSFSRLW
ncbi:MAG TPA: hypothetical protein VF363_03430, partial [Candidatus Eisenbacteria bacterium]